MYKHKSKLLSSLFLFSSALLACPDDQYEQCVAFVCACLPKVDGDIGKAGETIKNTLPSVDVNSCLADISKCVTTILAAPLAAPIKTYLANLYVNTNNSAQHFTPEFIALVQPYYEANLSNVTFANNVNTGINNSVSYCDRIFFTTNGNPWADKNELHLTLHELEHVVQCEKRGKDTYLAEYMLKASLDVLKSGTFNVHDIHDYEVAAESKANQLTDKIWNSIQNGSVPVPPWLAIQRQTPANTPYLTVSNQQCMAGYYFINSPGGVCCSNNNKKCMNLTTGITVCSISGC
ncbi:MULTISPECIES: hypothetical protein [unclassified Citrobacter]|uniref:hypothetical protein n=1 Tax=unclassified Citrobacter TaxID=2644389 RepID=UPI00129BCA95|nr:MULTISPECIES: hypothetical protein [unclassified Citrobacter]